MEDHILSIKGNILKCVEGYIHRKKRVYKETTYWVCVEKNCLGKLTTTNGIIVSGPKDHYHEANHGEYVAREQRNMVKRDAKENPSSKSREIYNSVNSELINKLPLNEDLIGTNLKPFESLKPTIYRIKRSRYPALPKFLSELSIPQDLRVTRKDEPFLLSDNHDQTNRIIIFGTPSFLRILCEEKRVFADGTFKCVPNFFNSLYTLHVMRDGIMVTCVYCLLTNRTSSTYINMLRMIQDICSEYDLALNPESFTIDFELAMVRAINTVLPQTQVVGCLFHFSQCLRRKVQELGLARQYSESNGDNGVQKTVRRVAALAFMKLENLEEAYTPIVLDMPEENHLLDEFMSYFHNNFFKENARFPPKTWNHFLNDGPRTNNHVEGWHNSFNQRIGRHHANIWYFLEKVIQQQEVFENNLLIARQGNRVCRRDKKNIAIDERIRVQKLKYERGDLNELQFIDSIRYNFSFNV